MKLAIAYSSKNQFELVHQTYMRLRETDDFWYHKLARLRGGAAGEIFWCDGSTEQAALDFANGEGAVRVLGGADAAIAWKLSTMLASPANYTHIGLLESDVLLDPDWLEPTLALFKKGKQDGLSVGAVSPRSYVDRVLIQRDGYAVMHNLGAGCVIFTRAAADIVLRTFRTGFWRDNVRLFGQLSGIDLRTYAAFRGNEDNPITTDWGWEVQLARHGLAALALTPAKCVMIGQNPPLEAQGLKLVDEHDMVVDPERNAEEFERYRNNLARLRAGCIIDIPGMLCRQGTETLIFPHQLPAIGATWAGTTELKWSQGFGPFAYRAGEGGASLAARVSGTCSFLLAGGDVGARVTIQDTRSGFKFDPQLPAMMDGPASISVPGGPIPRQVTLDMAEGVTLYGLSCSEPQMVDTSWKFDWSQLPSAT